MIGTTYLSRAIVALATLCSVAKGVKWSDFTEQVHGSIEQREIPSLTSPGLIRYWGYSCEEHYITTEDGYILEIHRIPGKAGESGTAKYPVFVAHGMTSSSAQWTFGPPDKSLAYVLSDAGYDVWLFNARGNTYSKNHTHFDTCSSCPEYWSFGFHEGGIYDFPAIIDHILQSTGSDDLFYIGHSMGTTQLMVFLSELQEYNSKLRAGFLLAPAVFMTNAYSPIFLLSEIAGTIEDLLHLFGFYEFMPHPDFVSWLGHQVCDEEESPIVNELCSNIAFLLYGINPDQLNSTMIPVYMDHIPAGTSSRPLVHFAQLHINGNRFQKYDFGNKNDNLLHYGQEIPPDYDLSKVSAPIAIFVGDSDDLSTPEDTQHLANILPNTIHYELLDYPGCSHMDFTIGLDARSIIYDPVLKMMSELMKNEIKV